MIDRRVHQVHIHVYCELKVCPTEDTLSAIMYVILLQLVTYLTSLTYRVISIDITVDVIFFVSMQ